MRRKCLLLTAIAGLVGAGLSVPAFALPPTGSRVDLRVLVMSQGDSGTTAIAQQLTREGVPYDLVDLNAASRPTINSAYLSDVVGGVKRAKYQAVVLPNANPFTNQAEYTALTDYERQFGVKQVDAFVWPGVSVGLQPPTFSGTIDGATATVTTAGLAGAFKYLRGPVPFEDNDPAVWESYAYLASPQPDANGSRFDPLVTAPVPGGTGSGVLLGSYNSNGRTELVSTFAFNANQQQFMLLAHGIVEWMTDGVHLGNYRNYFSVHVDDVLAIGARWSVEGNCTPGDECTGPYTTPEIRMNPSDVTYAVEWQNSHGFTLDMFFNAGVSEQIVAETGKPDPLATSVQTNAKKFRWANHTYTHLNLGCKQDFSVIPWRCVTDPATGAIVYTTQKEITDEISLNAAWATSHKLPIDKTELVTGEHSGLFLLPRQPEDNPNLAPAFKATGITWVGSDNSRDPQQRSVGTALTVPRYPINVYYNVATQAEEVDEYNWIYTSRAQGGSGLCEDNPAIMTCMASLDPTTGYTNTIVPAEARIALSHVLINDPRPHYIHQSNLTEDRLIYPFLDRVISTYKAEFAANTPMVNQRMSANGAAIRRQAAWKTAVAAGTVSAYLLNGKVVVKAPSGLEVPISVPTGTRNNSATGAIFGTAYAGSNSAFWKATSKSLTLVIPANLMPRPTVSSTASPTATPTATSTARSTATSTATSTARSTATSTATSTARSTATSTARSTVSPTASQSSRP